LAFFHPRWPVFHEDNHLLVLYKPAGLVMQPDSRHRLNLVDMAKAWLKERYSKPGRVFAGMVHRLDAPVAGVLVLARTSKAASRLSEQFRAGSVRKTYLAVVQGRPKRSTDRLVNQLARRGRYSRPGDGELDVTRVAALSYRLVETRAGLSLLEVHLETGRRHQIRAQLAAAGCPIWGDVNYGAPLSLPHGRIALLAHRLSFIHPTLQKTFGFISPIPQGWPWPLSSDSPDPPCWSIEDFQDNGLGLP
jgi:23S rRNA pseudouridine1911/1915/1917 synthase